MLGSGGFGRGGGVFGHFFVDAGRGVFFRGVDRHYGNYYVLLNWMKLKDVGLQQVGLDMCLCTVIVGMKRVYDYGPRVLRHPETDA